MTPPIVFCHYGNRKYLRYVFECARLTNPRKEVVLLGDDANRGVARRSGIRHEPFANYASGERLETFEERYRPIQGSAHKNVRGGRDWLKFVFERWFYVRNFARSEGLEAFWHFDSDNMLLTSLAEHEERLAPYDCTEQCNGSCMNGFISGPQVVEAYLDTINDVFARESFLQSEQARFDRENPDWAFTEMSAFSVLKAERRPKTVRLNAIYEGTSFDDCICQAHGLAMEPIAPGREIKLVHLRSGGLFECEVKDSGALVRMNSLNLSWVPVATFRIVFEHLRGPAQKSGASASRAVPDTLAGRLVAESSAPALMRLLRKMGRPFAGKP